MSKALCLFPLEASGTSRLRAAWPGEIEFVDANTQDYVDAIEDADLEVLLGDFVPSDRARVPNLRWIQYSGAGVDALAPISPWKDGLLFTTASGVNSVPIGQYVIGAILVVAGKWRDRLRADSERLWDGSLRLVGRSLRDASIGILGYGSIGREVGRLADALGMRVIVTKRRIVARKDDGYVVQGTGDPEGMVPSIWLGPDQLSTLAEQADFVCVTVPLTEETRNVIGPEFFGHMKRTAWLINVSRGEVIDEQALVEALDAGELAGAIVDVATREPLPDTDQLWAGRNLIVTPHISGMVEDPWSPLIDLFEENLARYASGQRLLNLVDALSGY